MFAAALEDAVADQSDSRAEDRRKIGRVVAPCFEDLLRFHSLLLQDRGHVFHGLLRQASQFTDDRFHFRYHANFATKSSLITLLRTIKSGSFAILS